MIGQTLGNYAVTAKLGAGGMGEVYRAKDTRLDRDVAIKVLPEATAGDAEHRARLAREARVISRLAHPNICTLLDVGEEGGRTFLVMELLQGETLAQRLQQRVLPIAAVLRTAREVLAALHAAHREGIVHRDLKPGNIMLTPTGVKLLDFGLAKWAPRVSADEATAQVVDATAPGTILGTLQYMAPEQLEGRPVDARADLFAAGAVFYEMVTGRRAFEGSTQAALIAAILKENPPPIADLNPAVPAGLSRVIRTCLEKHPDDRWQSAADLQHALALVADDGPTGPVAAAERHGQAHAAIRLAAGAALVAAGWLGHAWIQRPDTVVRPTRRVQVPISPAEVVLGSDRNEPLLGYRPSRTAIALSSSGQTLAFTAQRGNQTELFVRQLGQEDVTPVPETTGAESPFFSPDDRWLGFWQDGRLRKWASSGGAPLDVCRTPRISGATWLADGTIVFAAQRIFRCHANGGAPEPLFVADRAAGEIDYRLPSALPGGRVILYTVMTGTGPRDFRIAARPLAGGPPHAVMEDASDGRYVATGHLLFARDGALFAAPFDADRAVTTGGAVSVLTDVMHAANVANDRLRTAAAQVAVSASGDLAYLKGGLAPDWVGSPVWIEKNVIRPIGGITGAFQRPRLSPDGTRIAVLTRGRDPSLWVYRVNDETRLRVPFDGAPEYAEWISNSTIALSGVVRGVARIYRVSADGAGAPEALTAGSVSQIVTSVASDGSALLYLDDGDIWHLPLPSGSPRRLFQTPELEASATLSPDREWLAYETGNNVYVQPYPGLDARYPVWQRFSRHPRWSRDGRRLYFSTLDDRYHVMRVDLGAPGFAPVNPRTLWSTDPATFVGGLMTAPFEVDARERILGVAREPPLASPARVIHLITNWFDELRARVAAAR
jgi:serine/threonine protein kinase